MRKKTSSKNTTAVVPAAGRGRRTEFARNKIFLPLRGKPVLIWALQALEAVQEINRIIVCAHPQEIQQVKQLIEEHGIGKVQAVVEGGEERQDSVYKALKALDPSDAFVVVHDAARPLARPPLIEAVLDAAKKHRTAVCAIPCTDTIKLSDESGFAFETLPRHKLFAVQTPQAFDAALLREAHEKARRDGFCATDDAALVERLGIKVKLVEGDPENIKLTTKQDFALAEMILQNRFQISDFRFRHKEQREQKSEIRNQKSEIVRVGFGFDAHQFVEGRPLILGGVRVPFEKGLHGHSDADVVLHALCDALLGAASIGDLGQLFPDTDPQFKGISSLILLQRTLQEVRQRGFEVVNADVTIVAQQPKLSPHKEAMRKKIAEALGIDIAAVSIKATTTDQLGFVGRGEGMAAFAVVQLKTLS